MLYGDRLMVCRLFYGACNRNLLPSKDFPPMRPTLKDFGMYLCIYKRGNKYYSQAVKHITENFTLINENMETVKLGYKQKIASFAFNGWEDFKKIKKYLQVNYGLRLFVADIKAPDKTYQKFIIELMNNPFYELMLAEREEKNDVSEDDAGNVRIIELWKIEDWELAQKEFGFTSDFYQNIFTAEELPN